MQNFVFSKYKAEIAVTKTTMKDVFCAKDFEDAEKIVSQNLGVDLEEIDALTLSGEEVQIALAHHNKPIRKFYKATTK